MPIELPKEAYKILRRLTGGERLFGIPGDCLTYEFMAGNIKTHADSIAVGYLFHKGFLKPSEDKIIELVFQGNLNDFSIRPFKMSQPRPGGKQNPKRY